MGYEGLNSAIIEAVNGKTIGTIKDLAEALQEVPAVGVHTIEFVDYPKVIYVDDRASQMVNQQLIQYGIGELQRLD